MRGDDGDTGAGWWSIGNGMAGARTVEEILARGGAEQFAITMFGDEPYGNYNRIMLSHVLSGEETDADIFLNSLPWYIENDITLHAGVRVDPDRPVRQAGLRRRRPGRRPYDKLIIATGSRSFMPADRGPAHRRRRAAAGRLRVPHHRRHPRRWSTTPSTMTTAGPW